VYNDHLWDPKTVSVVYSWLLLFKKHLCDKIAIWDLKMVVVIERCHSLEVVDMFLFGFFKTKMAKSKIFLKLIVVGVVREATVSERARLAFNVYDRNRDGFLTKAELRRTSKKMTEAQVRISSTFYVRFFVADILAPNISNPKHSFVVFGAKIFAKKVQVKC